MLVAVWHCSYRGHTRQNPWMDTKSWENFYFLRSLPPMTHNIQSLLSKSKQFIQCTDTGHFRISLIQQVWLTSTLSKEFCSGLTSVTHKGLSENYLCWWWWYFCIATIHKSQFISIFFYHIGFNIHGVTSSVLDSLLVWEESTKKKPQGEPQVRFPSRRAMPYEAGPDPKGTQGQLDSVQTDQRTVQG